LYDGKLKGRIQNVKCRNTTDEESAYASIERLYSKHLVHSSFVLFWVLRDTFLCCAKVKHPTVYTLNAQ